MMMMLLKLPFLMCIQPLLNAQTNAQANVDGAFSSLVRRTGISAGVLLLRSLRLLHLSPYPSGSEPLPVTRVIFLTEHSKAVQIHLKYDFLTPLTAHLSEALHPRAQLDSLLDGAPLSLRESPLAQLDSLQLTSRLSLQLTSRLSPSDRFGASIVSNLS